MLYKDSYNNIIAAKALSTENEHQISRVSLSEAMNIIYISTNAADISDNTSGVGIKDSELVHNYTKQNASIDPFRAFLVIVMQFSWRQNDKRNKFDYRFSNL